MGFLKKLLGGSEERPRPAANEDPQGVYFYVQCDRCGAPVRLRADKQHDLLNEGNQYVWHKTIVDNRCFRPMPTVVTLDSHFQVTAQEISGGHYITREEYEALLAADRASREAAAAEEAARAEEHDDDAA